MCVLLFFKSNFVRLTWSKCGREKVTVWQPTTDMSLQVVSTPQFKSNLTILCSYTYRTEEETQGLRVGLEIAVANWHLVD